MSITGKKIAVIGGGVSGLAAGAVAALRGAQVTIFERSSGPSSAGNGTGLQISPNGVRVLKALGWPDRWALPFEKARTLRMKHGPSGKTLASLDLRSRTGDANYMLVRRSDLVASLAQCAQDHGASLITNTPADVTFDQDRFRVVTDGQSAPNDFEIVIAADGIHSMLRQRHLPGGVAASATGQLAWRALTPVSAVTEELQEELLEGPCLFVGPGMHLVTYLVPDGTMINVVAVAPNSARDTNFSQVGHRIHGTTGSLNGFPGGATPRDPSSKTAPKPTYATCFGVPCPLPCSMPIWWQSGMQPTPCSLISHKGPQPRSKMHGH